MTYREAQNKYKQINNETFERLIRKAKVENYKIIISLQSDH